MEGHGLSRQHAFFKVKWWWEDGEVWVMEWCWWCEKRRERVSVEGEKYKNLVPFRNVGV